MTHRDDSHHSPTAAGRPSRLAGRAAVRMTACTAAALFGAATAHAQMTFSIDWKGPTISIPDTGSGTPITEADLLAPGNPVGMPLPGPLPPPLIATSGGMGPPFPGLAIPGHPFCIGHPPGTPCQIEVDAVSYGIDHNLDPGLPYMPGGNIWFSVDEFAIGMPGFGFLPEVATEAPFGDAAADVFTEIGLMPGPLPPFAIPPMNLGIIDGDGLPGGSGFAYPGTGLKEPIALPAALPRSGDNLDALDAETPPGFFPVYYSLDAIWVDPISGIPHTGSAVAKGFSPSDVVVSIGPGIAPVVFIPAPMLGLDLAGFGTDDLDALIMNENGTGAYEPAQGPYSWVTGAFDMVLFSVRRGSAVVGMMDSMLGLPIEPGDILMPPPAIGLPPGIFIAAENLGLVTTRSMGVIFGDDLDGADALRGPMFFDCDGDGVNDTVAVALGLVPDCNANLVPDSCDIASGTSLDLNLDGVPDECGGGLGVPFCFGDGSDGAPCPCANIPVFGSGEGCTNSTGVGAFLVASGTPSVSLDTLILTVNQAAPSEFGIFLQNVTVAGGIPFYDGALCLAVDSHLVRHYSPPVVLPTLTDATGSGTNAQPMTVGDFLGDTVAAAVIHYQFWYRNSTGPCATGANFSSGLSVLWLP